MLNLNLQFFAHKKGMGSTKNGRTDVILSPSVLVPREQTVSS